MIAQNLSSLSCPSSLSQIHASQPQNPGCHPQLVAFKFYDFKAEYNEDTELQYVPYCRSYGTQCGSYGTQYEDTELQYDSYGTQCQRVGETSISTLIC